MAELDENTEKQILSIVEKYQKEENKNLNYQIMDDEITFFSPISNGNKIKVEDLQIIARILEGSFEGIELVNQEYRFRFKYGL
ncbi:hypothetical protein [Methanobrevibacter sp.]